MISAIPRRILPAIFIAAYIFPVFAQQIAPEPRKYLEQALDTMRDHAIYPKKVDWKLLREQSFAKADGAKSIEDTYPAIIYACAQLRQQHQCQVFKLPDSATNEVRRKAEEAEKENTPAARTALSPVIPSPFTERGEPQAALLNGTNGKAYAYLVVPHCFPPYSDFAKNKPFLDQWTATLRSLLIKANDSHPDGWIVDLRGNGGSNMWAAIDALGPLLGEGTLGFFETKDGNKRWFYTDGSAEEESQSPDRQMHDSVIQHVGGPRLLLEDAPVAVLFDNGTGGSGEAIAIAFAGRKKERSFGLHTVGATGCCTSYKLADGALLGMQFGVEADRQGHSYVEGLQPDVRVETNSLVNPTADPAIAAAEEWLNGAR